MRGFRAVLTLLAAVLCGPALAGPDDYVFEFRLLSDDGREVVATCRGRQPCVMVEDPLRRTPEFTVDVLVDSSSVTVGVSAYSASIRLQEITRDDHPGRPPTSFERRVVLNELPAVLRTER